MSDVNHFTYYVHCSYILKLKLKYICNTKLYIKLNYMRICVFATFIIIKYNLQFIN